MTAENEGKSAEQEPRPADAAHAEPKGFTAAEARQRAEEMAKQSRQKAEFILSRAYGLFRNPKLEWDQIKAEDTTIMSIVVGYVAPLVGFFSFCNFVGSIIFDHEALGRALIGTAVTFLVMTGFIYLLGYVVNAVAENFDSDPNDLAAQKVAAYSFTPFFLSGVFLLWPPLIWLTFVAIGVSAFLIYRGLPPLMKTPPDRAMGYAATVCIVGLIAFVLAFIVAGCVTGAGHI